MDGPLGTVALGMGGGYVKSVGRGGGPADLGKDFGTAGSGHLQFFQYEQACPFAENKPVPVDREWPCDPGR